MKRVGAVLALFALSCVAMTKDARVAQELALAHQFASGKQPALAVDRYAAALDLAPTNLTALRGYVELCQKTGRLDEAVSRFSDRLLKVPGDAYAHEGLGLAYYARGGATGEKAQDELATAVRLAPEVADFHYRLGVVLVDEDAWEDAAKALADAVKLDPKRPRYRLPYAVALARLGDRPGSIAQLKAVLTLQPTTAEMAAATRTAAMLVDPFRGFPKAAREQYELALGWLSHDALTQAQQVLDNLTEKFPDLAIVHATSGLCAAKQDQQGRAIVEYRKAVDLAPDLAEPHLYLGDLYASHGQPEKAADEYEAALERNPFLADAYERLAEAHLKAGDKADAADRYGTYLLLRPDDFEAQVAHATLLSDLGRGEAGDAWDALAKSFPSRPEVLVGRARWYFGRAATGKKHEERQAAWQSAKESLDQALALDSKNETAAAMLSQLEKLRP